MSRATRYRRIALGGCLEARVERTADGGFTVRSLEPLAPYPERITDRLIEHAERAPERVLMAKRDASGRFRELTYGAALRSARAIAEALCERVLGPARTIAILSDNDLEHLQIMLGATLAGIPYTSISPAYSLISRDFGKLRHVLDRITPGLVYAARAEPYAAAIEAAVPRDAEVVLGQGELDERPSTPFSKLLEPRATGLLERAQAKVGPETVVKLLFTSGSTRAPKGVVHTHRMLCANQQMIAQCLRFLADEPPVLVDWLPWNHTFGGNHNIGIALYHGGSLYIDDGKPTPELFGETVRNLRELSPTVYFNVPKGFEALVGALDDDEALRASLFSRVKAFFFAGAGLSQAVWDRLDAHAERAIGERIPMITGLGMTETSPTSTFALRSDLKAGHIGLPVPGVELRVVPSGGKLEARFRGPHVMPGYFRDPELTERAFDEEGFYRTGDAVRWLDERAYERGLLFDGRLAEDFKLATGTFVSVGPLRARIIALGAPLVQDAVITGIDRNEVGALIVPRLDQCQRYAGEHGDDPQAALNAPSVQAFFEQLLRRLYAEGTGSATRVARAVVLREPLSIDRGEVTDKGSVNQRAVLDHRAAIVAALYDGTLPHALRLPGLSAGRCRPGGSCR